MVERSSNGDHFGSIPSHLVWVFMCRAARFVELPGRIFLRRGIAQLSVLIAISSICASAHGQQDGHHDLRILTYNIHHGEGTDSALDLTRIADVIREVNPDIVALQEVDQRVPRSKLIDQAKELSRKTDLPYRFGGNIDLQGGRYGNAVLTNLPIASFENRLLPRHRNGEQRGVMVLHLRWPDANQDLLVLATHFDHRRDESERLASVQTINGIAARQDSPAVLAGDLNATRDSEVLARLRSTWTVAGPDLPTIPVADPARQIDFVLFRPASVWTVVEARVLPESVASDHRALLTVLRFNENQ